MFPKLLEHGPTYPYLLRLVALLTLAAGSTLQGFHNALESSRDFAWGLSRALLFRQDPYLMTTEWLKNRGAPNPFIAEAIQANYMAPGLVFMWPIAVLPWELAKVAWAIVGVLCSIIISIVVNKRYLQGSALVVIFLTCALLASTPARATIGNGQASLFALAAFVLSLELVERQRYLAALFLAVSWIKYPLTFPLTLIFLRQGRLGVIIGAGLIHLGLLLFLSAWLWQDPLTLLLAPLPFMSQLKTEGFIDAFAIMNRLGITSAAAPLLLVVTLCGAALVATLPRGPADELLTLSILSIVSCLWVYHRIYDLVVFIIPLCYVLRHAQDLRTVRSGWDRTAFAWLSAAMVLLTWYLLSRAFEAKVTSMVGPAPMESIYGVAIVSAYGAVTTGVIVLLRGFHKQRTKLILFLTGMMPVLEQLGIEQLYT